VISCLLKICSLWRKKQYKTSPVTLTRIGPGLRVLMEDGEPPFFNWWNRVRWPMVHLCRKVASRSVSVTKSPVQILPSECVLADCCAVSSYGRRTVLALPMKNKVAASIQEFGWRQHGPRLGHHESRVPVREVRTQFAAEKTGSPEATSMRRPQPCQ